MKSLMVSVSGIRGIVGEGLTPETVCKYVSAFGTLCGRGKIVIGRDSRISGPMVEQAVISSLMSTGCSVINIGLSATPTVQLAVEKMNADGGIVITASHNPAEWNALKFLDRRGMFLGEEEGDIIKDIIKNDQYKFVNYKELGEVVSSKKFDSEHINSILCSDVVKPDRIRKKNFKAVVDCVNGAGSMILPEMLLELGCDVIKINCSPDGKFPRGAEPLPENLKDLCEKVKETEADIGFACDPDADRLAVVNEKGIPLGEENTLVLAILQVLKGNRGPVAVNVSTTAAIDFIVNKFNCNVFRSKVGEIHVVKKMLENDCVIGGEGNGGVIFPQVHYGRDAMVGASLVLQLLTDENKSISEIMNEIPSYVISKKKISIEGKELNSILSRIKKSTMTANIDETDGLKLIFKDYWVHLRASNTEPIIRIIAEASTKKDADEITDGYIKMINE
ncbi:phosphoglucosamine mutase [candidate division KSB1 bacterium]